MKTQLAYPSGNVAAVLNEDGLMVYVDKDGNIETASAVDNVACRFEYDAYGNNIYPSDDWNKRTAMEKAWATFPHHISTKEWDPEANLYYFGYRWYEPRQGAYVSRTPLSILDEETYGFCANDPVNFFDPNGLTVLGTIGEWYEAISWYTVAVPIIWADEHIAGPIYDYTGFSFFPTWMDQYVLNKMINRYNISQLDANQRNSFCFSDPLESQENINVSTRGFGKASVWIALVNIQNIMKMWAGMTEEIAAQQFGARTGVTMPKGCQIYLGLQNKGWFVVEDSGILSRINSYGNPVLSDGAYFYTRDITCHLKGAAWKKFNRKGDRIATLNADLDYIGP